MTAAGIAAGAVHGQPVERLCKVYLKEPALAQLPKEWSSTKFYHRAASGVAMSNLAKVGLPGCWGKSVTGALARDRRRDGPQQIYIRWNSDKKLDKIATDTAIDVGLAKNWNHVPWNKSMEHDRCKGGFSSVVRAAANTARPGVDSSTNGVAGDRAQENLQSSK
jgi:hypothetical protein